VLSASRATSTARAVAEKTAVASRCLAEHEKKVIELYGLKGKLMR